MDNLKNELLNITKSEDFIKYNLFHQGNIFSITKTSRLEHMQSNFVAWMLDSQSNHGLGDYPIKQFLAALQIAIGRSENSLCRWPNELDKQIPFVQFDFDSRLTCKAEREVTFRTKRKHSIDILLIVKFDSKKLPIIIENKVDSSEHDDQTQDYFEWSEDMFVDSERFYRPIYIYLTPKYNSSKPANINFINLKYQDLVDYVLEPALVKCTDEEVKNNISSYIRCLSYQSDNEKGGNIMATSKEEREILESFYQKNKNLMNSIIEMMLDDDDVDPRLKNNMSKLVSTRDYTKYQFDGNIYKKNQLVLAVVKKHVAENKSISFNNLIATFPKELQGSMGVIRKYCELKENEIRDKRFFIDPSDRIILEDGTECAVCSQWGAGNIERFIDKSRDLKYTITEA